MNNFDNALQTLNATVSSIAEKVDGQKKRVALYKGSLIDKLRQISDSLKNLRSAGRFDSIPKLKEDVTRLQQQLQDKEKELTTTQSTLSECQTRLRDLQQQMSGLNAQIAEKDEQIQQLKNSNGEKDAEITRLNSEKQTLLQEKQTAENNLAETNQQMEALTARILEINDNLKTQIELIVTIMNDLDVNVDDVEGQFTSIQKNIDDITKMVDVGPTGRVQSSLAGSTVVPYNVDDNINKLRELINSSDSKIRYETFIKNLDNKYGNSRVGEQVKSNIPEFKQGNVDNMRRIFEINKVVVPSSIKRGGKRKTMKKRYKRRCKRTCKRALKGGYVYSSNSKLDKVSSLILSSSKDKSIKKKSKRQKKNIDNMAN